MRGRWAVAEPCRCSAYPFPHRWFGGQCVGHEPDECPRPERDPFGTGTRWLAICCCAERPKRWVKRAILIREDEQ